MTIRTRNRVSSIGLANGVNLLRGVHKYLGRQAYSALFVLAIVTLVTLATLPAFGVNRTVKIGGGGTCTAIQTCVNLMAAGDTTTIFAGDYSAEGVITVTAGTLGNFKTITVNGDDLVYVKGFTTSAYTKIIGGTIPRPTATGLHVQNPSSPQANACIQFDSGSSSITQMYVSNTNFYACAAYFGMIGVPNAPPFPTYVFIQNNTFSYGGSTSSNPDVGGTMTAFGDHWLIEGNDFSHLMQAMSRIGEFGVIRNNFFHDVYGRDTTPPVFPQHDCIASLDEANGNTTTATVSGNTVTWTSTNPTGFKFFNFAAGMWVKFNGAATQYTIATVDNGTGLTMTLVAGQSPPSGAVTMQAGHGGNCHGEFFFGETNFDLQYTLVEGNTIYNNFGHDNKVALWQCDSPGTCQIGIVRFTVSAHVGGAGVEVDTAFPKVKAYNNTFADINANILSESGATNIYINGSTNGSDQNNIFTYIGSTTTGINPYECNNNITTTCATWVGNHDLAYLSGTGTLYGKNYEGGLWTDEATNIKADPQFVSYSPSTGLGNLALTNPGSPALQAGTSLTTVAAGDSGSGTTLVVADAAYFYAPDSGLGVLGDGISVGTTNCSLAAGHTATITAINYTTNTITTDLGLTRANADVICLWKRSDGTQVLFNTKPDMGALQTGISAPTCTLAASPSVIKAGTSSILTFTPSGTPTACSIDNGVGTVDCAGATPSVSPLVATTFTASVSNAGGSNTCSATVTIGGVKKTANTIHTANTVIQ